MSEPKIAILMAAGTGTRLRPITSHQPKPLVKVNGVPMIETVIGGLHSIGIKKIYIVTGYLGEQFSYLPEKYPDITLISNTEYMEKNNISSIYAARHILGTENCIISEADLLVSDTSIFKKDMAHSQYMGKWIEGDSDDWSFRLENGRMTKITTGGHGVYNMVGVSYWTKEDGAKIVQAVEEAYTKPGHEKLYWDEIVDSLLNEIHVCVQPVEDSQIIEIDTVEELQALDASYLNLSKYE